MTFADAIIIYLTCGSPFGVHHYLNTRKSSPSVRLVSKTIVAVLLWPVYAIALFSTVRWITKYLRDYSAKSAGSDSRIEKQVQEIRNRMEENLPNRRSPVTLFEFREIFDRYTGLTLALSNVGDETNVEAFREFYRIGDHENPQLAAICLNRRNRKRLSFHQTEARNDFLEFVSALWDAPAAGALAMELAELLSDTEAREDLRVVLKDSRQTQPEKAVSDLEKVLWKSHAPKPLPAARRTESSLRTMTASASSRSDD